MKKHVPFSITLIRGLLAVTLGITLLFQADKTRPMLANFMGMFWLVSGIISLRWGARGERAHRLAVVAGVIGVIAGLAMLTRAMASRWIAEDVFLSLLGLVILLTGVIHTFGGFQIGDTKHRKWSWTSALLGIFEIILGLMLVIEPYSRSNFFYLAASIWALVGGFILISDAIRLRRAALADNN